MDPVRWLVENSLPGYGGVQRSHSVEDVAAAMHPERERPVHDPVTARALSKACKAGALRATNPRVLPARYVAVPPARRRRLRLPSRRTVRYGSRP